MLRRFRRGMPTQETEMNEIEKNDIGSAQGEESAANDAAAAETGTVPDAGSEATAGPQAVESAVEESVPRAQYDQLKTERDQLLDRLARMQAEFENARKRAEREKAEYRDYAAGSVVEQFLPVLDNFELALKATGIDRTIAFRCGVDREADGRDSAADERDAGAGGGRGVQPASSRGAGLGGARLTCPINMLPKRFAAGTRSARSCCVLRWCASFPIQNRR